MEVGSGGSRAGVAGVGDILFRMNYLPQIDTKVFKMGVKKIDIAETNGEGVTHTLVKFTSDHYPGSGGFDWRTFG